MAKLSLFKFYIAILELMKISAEVQTLLTVIIKKLEMCKICLNYSFKTDYFFCLLRCIFT